MPMLYRNSAWEKDNAAIPGLLKDTGTALASEGHRDANNWKECKTGFCKTVRMGLRNER